MALPPGVIRLTQQAQSDLQGNLSRLQGQAEGLLNNTAIQNEFSRLQGAANSLTGNLNSAISVGNQFSIGSAIESATASFRDSLPSSFSELESFQDLVAGLGESIPGIGAFGGPGSAISGPSMRALGQTDNQLKAYASYNYIVTLACLTVNEINFPDNTYRNGPPSVPILRSGGGLGSTKVRTIYETEDLQLEYFIDDLEIEGIVAPTSRTRATNATVMNFTVTEPYSMGLFLQTMMLAANKAGHADYLKAPFALVIEFRGFDDDGNPLNLDSTTRRVFPISINTVDFDVTSGGSVYRIQANAWNETAFSSVAQRVSSDISITGSNVQELLQTGPNSLTAIMNSKIRTKDQQGNALNRDEYVIMFPPELASSLGLSTDLGTSTSDTATLTEEEYVANIRGENPELANSALDPALIQQNLSAAYNNYLEVNAAANNISAAIRRQADNTSAANSIGKATIDSAMVTGGAVPFGQAAYTYDQRTGIYRSDQIQISQDFRTFQFPTSTKIEDIIEEIVILSTYAQRAATTRQADPDGMIPWFRIHAQTFLSPDEEIRRRSGQNPKIYVYAVVPYRVHSSHFSQGSAPAVGIQQRIDAAAKSYNYIYTGENDDIIDFQIKFDNAFFTALSSNLNGNAGTRNQTRESIGASDTSRFEAADGNTSVRGLNSERPLLESPTSTQTGQAGGGDADTPAISVARNFHEAIVNNDSDMVTLDLTVIGDPYYLADSGQGNYNSPSSGFIGYTADGTMDYQRSEVEVYVNFKTPLDYNPNGGGVIFPEINNVPVNAFSGLYKVNTVRNSFAGGKFTQILELLRRNNQPTDVQATGTQDQASAVQPTNQDENTATDTNTVPPVTTNPEVAAALARSDALAAGASGAQ